MIDIINPNLSPALVVKEALIDGDGSICIYFNKKVPELVTNDAFFWMIETWLKANNVAYKVNREQKPYADEEGIRVFGNEISDVEYFINNLE